MKIVKIFLLIAKFCGCALLLFRQTRFRAALLDLRVRSILGGISLVQTIDTVESFVRTNRAFWEGNFRFGQTYLKKNVGGKGIKFENFANFKSAAAVKIERPLLITLPLLTIFCTKRFRPLRFANDAKRTQNNKDFTILSLEKVK